MHKKFGFDYSERFHTDPVYRNRKWKKLNIVLNKQFDKWGLGSSNPQDCYNVTTLDPAHLIANLFGSKVTYYENMHPDVHDYPLLNIKSLLDFNRKDEKVVEGIENLKQMVLHQVNEYGKEKVSIPFYLGEICGIKDNEHTHCPLTIAYRLFGENILYGMYDDPDGVRYVLKEIMLLTMEMAEIFRKAINLPTPQSAVVGACAATLISPEFFEKYLLENIIDYVAGRPFYFHSCGNVNRLFDVFANMNKIVKASVFDCREQAGIDLEAAVKAFPEAAISYMLSTAACLTRKPTDIIEAVTKAYYKTENNPLHIILNIPLGADKSLIDAFFDTCVKLGAVLNKETGFSFA